MKISQLLSIFPQPQMGEAAALEVTSVTQDSRQVTTGSVFVAIRGTVSDGHEFLTQAVDQGAIGLIVEEDTQVPNDFKGARVKVPSTRQALEQVAHHFYGQPSTQLFNIGVTGTNGKTTITYMLEKILNACGLLTGVIGTIDHHIGSQHWASPLTTPDPLTLHRRLREFLAYGAQATAFEVSSHALSQKRVDSVLFQAAIFTNFTRDHLDYHHTMDNYFAAKQRLFLELIAPGGVVILNGDDPKIRQLQTRADLAVYWYGVHPPADFQFHILKQDLKGTLFALNTPMGKTEVEIATPGLHNVYNAVAAIAAAIAAGCDLQMASAALKTFRGAPGRLESVDNACGLHIFVDYAHTEDALRTVLTALKALRTDSSRRQITVFGCGGDRDRGKRPLMARAAADLSDVLVMTSDNPRSEDPALILRDMQAGIPAGWSGVVRSELDRKQAFKVALQSAREGDVILVAGKGHEDYQIVGQETRSFLDTQVLAEILSE